MYQTGTTNKFATGPVNHYVRDLTKNIRRYKGLPAGKRGRLSPNKPPLPGLSRC